jgi:hypothetical protein
MNVPLLKTILGELTVKDLRNLRRLAGRELGRRSASADRDRARLAGGYLAMANFMAGVTSALACRNALRESKRHRPLGGTNPASGEMWMPREILKARAYMLAKYDAEPLTAADWHEVQEALEQIQRYREADLKPTAVKFVVPLVKHEGTRLVTLADLPD